MSIPAINLQLKGKRLGLVGILIFFQLFFFLETVVQSPIIPGNWTAYQLPMEFYLILTAVGMFLLGYGTKPLSIQKGGIGEFMLMFSVFGAAAWLLVAVLDHGGAALSGIDRIQLFVFVLIFVAPSEELVFRVALPPYVGWLIGSGIMFGIFHIFAYSGQNQIKFHRQLIGRPISRYDGALDHRLKKEEKLKENQYSYKPKPPALEL